MQQLECIAVTTKNNLLLKVTSRRGNAVSIYYAYFQIAINQIEFHD